MAWKSTRFSYQQTGFFSRIITDYLEQAADLSPFYRHPVSAEGFHSALEARKAFPTDRQTLVKVLEEQYAGFLDDAPLVRENIARLGEADAFTVCTAHQPAIFTG